MKRKSWLIPLVLLGLLTLFFLWGLTGYPHSAQLPSGDSLEAPSAAHWLGTDNLGVDIYAQLSAGYFRSMGIGLAAAAFTFLVGGVLGVLAGFAGGWVDLAVSFLIQVLLSIPQFILQMSVIYFIFRAFGYHNVGYLEIVAVQSLLQVSVSFMPMPGASGAQEIGFSSFFRNYFVNDDLYAAVMVWRFFTYYLVVIAGAILVVADQVWYRKKKLKEALSTSEPLDNA